MTQGAPYPDPVSRRSGHRGRPLLAGHFIDSGTSDALHQDELVAALDEHAIVSATDKSGRIIYVNELFCRTSGYAPFELLGSPHSIVKSGAHPSGLYRDLWKTISSGRVWHGELKNRRKDGTFYWVATTVVPTLDAHGKPLRYVSIRTNITAEKTLDEELLRQRAFLANIAEAVGEGILVEDEHGECVFANHEAAQLLGCTRKALLGCRLRERIVDSMGPIGFAHSAIEPTGETEPTWFPGRYEGWFIGLDGHRRPVLVSVQPMAQGSGIMGTVIAFRDHSEERRQRDALRRARAAADRASQAKSAFLANMSHEIRTPLNGVLGLARLALDESIDAPTLRRYLQGIVQIVSNLLSNAIKFTPRGSVHLQATMTAAGRVRLAVEDSGIGVEARVLARLFRPFVQADDSTTRQYGGSGLGLSICRALANEMDGRVGAQSVPGLGSVFWAELPLKTTQGRAPHAGASPASAPEDIGVSGLRVLLVEDNETNAVIASAMLERWGVDVSTARSGREALERIADAHGRFDLVLMDLHMPGMSGYEAARSLRDRYSAEALPIVALTAAAFEEDREHCRSVGMNDFVTKPVSAERLRATLVRWCNSR